MKERVSIYQYKHKEEIRSFRWVIPLMIIYSIWLVEQYNSKKYKFAQEQQSIFT